MWLTDVYFSYFRFFQRFHSNLLWRRFHKKGPKILPSQGPQFTVIRKRGEDGKHAEKLHLIWTCLILEIFFSRFRRHSLMILIRKKSSRFLRNFHFSSILFHLREEPFTTMLVQLTWLSEIDFSRYGSSKSEFKFSFPREILQQPPKISYLLIFSNLVSYDRDECKSSDGRLHLIWLRLVLEISEIFPSALFFLTSFLNDGGKTKIS